MKKSFLLSALLSISLLFCNASHLFSQQPTQEWVARYVRNPGQSIGPYFALDKQGDSYIAGSNIINDTINILCVKYNTSGVQMWATLYKYNGDSYFNPKAIAVDTIGNTYVVSNSGQSSLGSQNILTVKFNSANGSVEWAKKYVGLYNSSNVEDIKIDKMNNIYVVGSADSSSLCIQYNINGDSAWVKKFHPLGNVAFAHGCTIDDSLNIIIVGELDLCVSFPPPGGCFDTLLVAKYNSGGIFRWAKTYFYPLNPSITFGIKAICDQQNNIFVIGRTRRQNSGFYIYLTLKFNANGESQWASTYDYGGGDSFIRDLALDKKNGYVFVTGSSPNSNNQLSSATIKYDPTTGDAVWVKRDTGIYSNAGSLSIKVDTLGNSYVTGSSVGGSIQDLLTIKYNNQGIVSWLVKYGGPPNGVDIGYVLGLDNLNNVYVCGASDGVNFQESDYIIIKYSQSSSIHLLNHSIPKSFDLGQNYPNPFNPTTKIKFSIPKASTAQIKIYDFLGRVVATLVNENLTQGEHETEWDASDFASGVYFYQLIVNSEQLTVYSDTKKLVLIK